MRGNSQRDIRPLGESNLWSYFSLLWTMCLHTKLAVMCGSLRSLQCRFPIDDILLHSGDIRDQVAKLSEIAPKF